MPQSKRHNEAEVVRTSDLSVVLREIMTKHQEDHPPGNVGGHGWKGNQFTEPGIRHFGSYNWMSYETGVSHRILYNIVNNNTKTTSLSLTDQILTGLQHQHLLANGTIEIIPNPHWTSEHWQEYMEKRGCRR